MPEPERYAPQSPFTELQRALRERFIIALAWISAVLTLILAVLYAIMYVLRPSWQLAVGAGNGPVTLLVCLLSLRLAQRGKAQLASYILLPYLTFLTGLVSVVLGLVPVIAPVYIVFIVMAGMVWGPRSGYLVASVAAVLWLVAYFIVGLGLPPASPLSGTSVTIVLVILTESSFFFLAFVSQASTSGLWRALDNAAFDLIEANRQLEEANRHKSRFVARMSHDLRSPLNAIMLSTDLTLRKLYGPVTDKQQEVFGRIAGSARDLQTLIDDIMDITRIEAGQLALVEQPFSPRELAEAVRISLHQKARDKGLDFDIAVAPDMPLKILGDKVRLGQVLVNLAENAIKFTEEGEVKGLIEPVLDGGETGWRITVRDTGVGIHESDLEVIFEEFRQAERAPSTSKASGAGLGLAITRHLVLMMGGEIMVNSTIGKGSTFEVRLPLKSDRRDVRTDA